MISEDFSFTVGNETLAATRLLATPDALPEIVTFHGLGKTANRHTTLYLLERLAALGHSSIRFEFSGNGDSTGTLENTNLRTRLNEGAAAVELLPATVRPVLIGTSMGGHIAASLIAAVKPKVLILFCPAAYPQEALEVNFGSGLPRPDNYENSSAFAGIRAFRGNLLIIGARNDQVVASRVIEKYLREAVLARSKQVIWLDDCDHFIHRWLPDQNTLLSSVISTISKLI